MNTRTRCLVLALALAGVWPAAAQEVTLAPSLAINCLLPAADVRGTPDYPFEQFKSRIKGRVKVELVFTTPATRPEVKVLEHEGDDNFVRSVKDHVRDLRVPCHDGSATPARLVFDYVFKPDDRQVHWATPLDADDPARGALLRCVKNIRPQASPDYPTAARGKDVQGTVLARLRFDSPDGPPVAQVFAQPSAELLRAEIEGWVKGYRMPCHTGAPVEAVWTLVFSLKDDGGYGFRDMELLTYLRVVRDIDKQLVQFDLKQMTCPFEVRLQYRRPHLPNLVGEVGNRDPARRPFLDWLAAQELNIPKASLDAVFGDTARITVPCVTLDLKPKEKNS